MCKALLYRGTKVNTKGLCKAPPYVQSPQGFCEALHICRKKTESACVHMYVYKKPLGAS